MIHNVLEHAEQLNVSIILKLRLLANFTINDPQVSLAKSLGELIELVISIFFVYYILTWLTLAELIFGIENQVIVFALNLLVDVEQVDVLDVCAVEFILPGLPAQDSSGVACEPTERIALTQHQLVVGNFQDLTQPASQFKILLACVAVR